MPARAPTYGAVKAGLHGFADGLRRQHAPKTHVLELLPQMVDTPINAKATGKKMSPQDVPAVTLKALAQRRPMALRSRRVNRTALCRFTSTDESRF